MSYISYTPAKRDDEDKYIDEEDVDSNTFRTDQEAPRLKRNQNKIHSRYCLSCSLRVSWSALQVF